MTIPEPPMLAPAQATARERKTRKEARSHQLRATPTIKKAVPKVAARNMMMKNKRIKAKIRKLEPMMKMMMMDYDDSF